MFSLRNLILRQLIHQLRLLLHPPVLRLRIPVYKKGSDRKNGKKPPKRKFLDTYCENLTRKAREGKLDDIIGRDREIYRTILNNTGIVV